MSIEDNKPFFRDVMWRIIYVDEDGLMRQRGGDLDLVANLLQELPARGIFDFVIVHGREVEDFSGAFARHLSIKGEINDRAHEITTIRSALKARRAHRKARKENKALEGGKDEEEENIATGPSPGGSGGNERGGGDGRGEKGENTGSRTPHPDGPGE